MRRAAHAVFALLAWLVVSPADAAFWLRVSNGPPSPIVASITPGPGWLTDSNAQGVDNSGNGSISGASSYAATAPAGLSYTGYVPQESSTPHGSGSVSKVAVNFNEPASMWYEPSSVRSVCVFGGINNRQGFDHVDFILEGTTVTVSQETWDSRTHMGGWCIKPLSPVGKDGNAVLYARVVPVNGLERVIALPMVLDTNAGITRSTCYLNPQTVGASDTGDAAINKCAPGTPGGIDKPFMSFQYAQKHVPSGANVLVAAGSGTLCGQAGYYCEQGNGGGNSGGAAINASFYVSRMITFLPDPATTGTVTVARGVATSIGSAPLRYMGSANDGLYDKSGIIWSVRASKVQFKSINFNMYSMAVIQGYRSPTDQAVPYATYPEDILVFGPNCVMNDPYGPLGAGQNAASYSNVGSPIDPGAANLIFTNNGGSSIALPYGTTSLSPSQRYAVIESSVSNYLFAGEQFDRNVVINFAWDVAFYAAESSNNVKINVFAIQAGKDWAKLQWDDNNFITGTSTFDGTYTSFRYSYDIQGSNAAIGGSVFAFISGNASTSAGQMTTSFSPVTGLTTVIFSTPNNNLHANDYIRLPNTAAGAEGERAQIKSVISTTQVTLNAPFLTGDITTPVNYYYDPIVQAYGSTSAAGTMTTAGTAITFGSAGPAVGDTIGYFTLPYVSSPSMEMRTIASMSDSTHGVLDSAFSAGSIGTATNYYLNYGYGKILGDYTSLLSPGDKIRGHNVAHPDIAQWGRRNEVGTNPSSQKYMPNPENLTWNNYHAVGQQVQTWEMQNGYICHDGSTHGGACGIGVTASIASVGVDGNGNQTLIFSADVQLYPNDEILDLVTEQTEQVTSYNAATFTATLAARFPTTPTSSDGWNTLKTFKDAYVVNSVMGKFSPDASFGLLVYEGGVINFTIAQSTTIGAVTQLAGPLVQTGQFGTAMFDDIFMVNLGSGALNAPAYLSTGANPTAAVVTAPSLSGSLNTNQRYLGVCTAQGFSTDQALCFSGNVMDGFVDLGDSTTANGYRKSDVYASSPSTGMALDSQYRPLANISRPMIGNTITGKPLEPWDCFGNPITTGAVVGACH